jgi:mono/diheme cytochrome c family protein
MTGFSISTLFKEVLKYLVATLLLGVGAAIGMWPGCTKSKPADTAAPTAPVDPLVERGAAVYAANCTACHGRDPKRAGTLGPEVAESSVALLEAKVIAGTYPPGYTPKRKSQAMVPLPHLKADIPALHAYLNQP